MTSVEPPGPDTPFGWALARRRGDDAAVARLYALKAERHLSEDDPLWEFIDLQEGYLDKYQFIAQQLAETVKAATRRLAWRQITVTLGLAGTLVAAAGWWAFGDGWVHGHREGYETAQSEFAQAYDLSAAAWAMTSRGRRARELDREGLLGWAASQEAREMRRLGPEGYTQAALEKLEEQGLATVARSDAQWLASPAGQRARTLSQDDWDWLASQAGQQARSASEDGSLAWLISEDGQDARELSQNGIFNWAFARAGESLNPQLSARLQALPEEEKEKWMFWLGALLGTGVLHDGGGTVTQRSCGWELWGYTWQKITFGYDDYCRISPDGRVLIQMRRG